MEKNTGKVREFCHPGKVGTLIKGCTRVVATIFLALGANFELGVNPVLSAVTFNPPPPPPRSVSSCF